jgi:hypothetical protein
LFAHANSKGCSESAKEFLFWLSLLSLVDFLQCTLQSRLSEQFSESQAAFETTGRVIGGYLKDRTSFLENIG